MAYIPYCGAKCYPIFPCLEENDNMYKYDVDKMLEAMTILQNFEIPENLIFYFQRETLGFQLIADALQNANFIHFDDYGDVVDSELTPVNGKIFKKLIMKTTVVIDSTSLAFTFPRVEHNYIEKENPINEENYNENNAHNNEFIDTRVHSFYDCGFEPETYIHTRKFLYPACSLWSLNILFENMGNRHRSNVLDRHIGPKPTVKQKFNLNKKENFKPVRLQ